MELEGGAEGVGRLAAGAMVEVVEQQGTVVGVRAVVDDFVGALHGVLVAQVGDTLVGDDDVDAVLAVVGVGHHGQEGAPPLLALGQEKMEMKALRVKSPLPPIPFIMRVPSTWVELTLPKMSASMAVFMAMTPRRRITSGLLLISAGRITILSWK